MSCGVLMSCCCTRPLLVLCCLAPLYRRQDEGLWDDGSVTLAQLTKTEMNDILVKAKGMSTSQVCASERASCEGVLAHPVLCALGCPVSSPY